MVKKEFMTDKKNKTSLQMADGVRTHRTVPKNSTINNSIMSMMKKSNIELKSKNASIYHLKEAGLVSTQD
jgi:hypothetical protein